MVSTTSPTPSRPSSMRKGCVVTSSWIHSQSQPSPGMSIELFQDHVGTRKLRSYLSVELVLSFTGHIRGDLRAQVTHDQLQDWHLKPWSLRIATANHHGYPHVFDRWCDSCDRKASYSTDGEGIEDRLLDESRARTSRQRELGEQQNRPTRADRRTPRRDPGGESSLYPLHDWQDAFLRNELLDDRTTRVTFYGIALDALRTQQGSVPELTGHRSSSWREGCTQNSMGGT